MPNIGHSLHPRQLQTLALTERGHGCLAACSDVETFDHSEGEVTYAPPAPLLLEAMGDAS